jgi:hypothetical protein
MAAEQVLNYHKARLHSVALVVWLLTVLVLVGCVSSRPAQPELTQAQLVGTWRSQAGSFTFSANHSFTATELNFSGFMGQKCRLVTYASGTWQFEGPSGWTGDIPTTYSTGNVIYLDIEQSSDEALFSCTDMWKQTALTT